MKRNHRRGPFSEEKIVINPVYWPQLWVFNLEGPFHSSCSVGNTDTIPSMDPTLISLCSQQFLVWNDHSVETFAFSLSLYSLRWRLVAKRNLNLSVTVLDFKTVRIIGTLVVGLIQGEPFLPVSKADTLQWIVQQFSYPSHGIRKIIFHWKIISQHWEESRLFHRRDFTKNVSLEEDKPGFKYCLYHLVAEWLWDAAFLSHSVFLSVEQSW